MPYVDVEVELDDFGTDDLIKELEYRGYKIANHNDEMQEVVWRYTRGYIEDAMILLEKLYPDLYGLHKRIK